MTLVPSSKCSNWIAIFCNMYEVIPWGILRMQFSLLGYHVSMVFGTYSHSVYLRGQSIYRSLRARDTEALYFRIEGHLGVRLW